MMMRPVFVVAWSFALAFVYVSADRGLMRNAQFDQIYDEFDQPNIVLRIKHFLWQSGQPGYHHVWPVSILKLICACVNLFIFISLSFLRKIETIIFFLFRDNVQDLRM